MSIIQNAFKKTEGRKEDSAEQNVKSGSEYGGLRKPGKFSKKKHFVRLAIVFFSVLGAAFLTFNLIKNKKFQKTSAAYSTAAGLADKIFNRYAIEGIVYDEEDPYAVINGEIVGKNDKLDNFIVIDITENTVELLNPENNTKLTLSSSF